MFTKKNFFRFVVLSLLSSAALAASVPHTFTSGAPAVAAEVNANFSALVNAINALETRVAALETSGGPAPTMASIAGTYDAFQVGVEITGSGIGFGIAGSGGSGTIVLNADGTGQDNVTAQRQSLSGSLTQNTNVATATPGNNNAGCCLTINSLDNAQITDLPEAGSGAFTWSLSNGVVTANGTGYSVSLVVAGQMLISGTVSSGGVGENSILILVRRP